MNSNNESDLRSLRERDRSRTQNIGRDRAEWLTLRRRLCGLAKQTGTQHPIAVQLEAGTSVTVVENPTGSRMVDIRASDGGVYTVFADDLYEQVSSADK